jgi:hypothetical protein
MKSQQKIISVPLVKYTTGDTVKLIPSVQEKWEGWGFDKSVIVRPVLNRDKSKSQQYIIQADNGHGSTMSVKEHEITSR